MEADTDFTMAIKHKIAPKVGGIARIVVAGEVRAGKSSLVSAITRGVQTSAVLDALPVAPVHYRYGAEATTIVQLNDGRSLNASDCTEELSSDDVAGVYVNLPNAQLEALEIVEVPFFVEGGVTERSLALMNSADTLIWVTIASQARRLSEKSILDQVKECPDLRRLLVVSRADKVRLLKDREKINERLEKEAGDYFEKIFFLKGAPNTLAGSETDAELWKQTAGHEIYLELRSEIAPELVEMPSFKRVAGAAW